jgi:uncharacterized MnhB-related membrane protein
MTETALWAFDILLASALVWLTWLTLRVQDHFQAVVAFLVFGLLMALVWARLAAPDVALAEAAIGAGITGALFLSTLRRVAARDKPQQHRGGR